MFVQAKILMTGSLKRKSNHRLKSGDGEPHAFIVEVETTNSTAVKTRQHGVVHPARSDPDTSSPTDPWFQINQELPGATRAECQRFWLFHRGNSKVVRENIKGYLQWRKIHNLVDERTGPWALSALEHRRKDREDWEQAWEMTWKHAAKQEGLFPDDAASPGAAATRKQKNDPVLYPKTIIPQYIFCHRQGRNRPGIFQVVAAQMDIHAASPEHHTLAVALYFDRKVSRQNATHQCNLWLDVRGAPGWANPSPLQMFPIVCTFAHHLLRLHPERLNQLVIFPLPGWAVTIFKMIRKVLPTVVQDRMVFISGSERHDVPLQVDKTAEKGDVSKAVIEGMELLRNQAMEKAAKAQL